MEYVDFEITFIKGSRKQYHISIDSPEGEPQGLFKLPDTDRVYQDMMNQLGSNNISLSLLKDVGIFLFKSLFQGNTAQTYQSNIKSLKSFNKQLRIILKIAEDDIDIAMLPWELLCDPEHGLLALESDPPVSIVRYLKMRSTPTTYPKMQQMPIRVLLTSAEPIDRTGADIGREFKEIRQILFRLEQVRQLEIVLEPNLTPETFNQRIREGFHVWHFIGHSEFNQDAQAECLLFEDESGHSFPMDVEDICLRLKSNPPNLIFINTSQYGHISNVLYHNFMSSLLNIGVGTIVGMQSDVATNTTREFAQTFYNGLTDLPIDVCVTLGRKQITLATSASQIDCSNPIVYTRMAHGKLFDPPKTVLSNARVLQTVNVQEVPAIMEGRYHKTLNRAELREIIMDHFSESEIHDLCFDLSIDHEELQHSTKRELCRELVAFFERRERTSELIAALRRLRPHIGWWKFDQVEYLIDVGVLQLFLTDQTFASLMGHQQENIQAAKQIISRTKEFIFKTISAKDIHKQTISMIICSLIQTSIEQYRLYNIDRIGDQGLIGLSEALHIPSQPYTNDETTSIDVLSVSYKALFTKLQQTIPPVAEPVGDQYRDSYYDLLDELTEVWIQLPPDQGVFKCIEILQIVSPASRSRLFGVLESIAPAIRRFHPQIVNEIAAVAKHVVQMYP